MNLFDLFFPRRCVSCSKIGKYICEICREKIKYIEFPFCPVCRFPSINGMAHARCCSAYSPDGLYVSAHYSGPVKKAIRLMKYRYVTDVIDELTGILLIKLPVFLKEFDYLIPVPLHPKKEKSRGFNQSLLIASRLGKKIDIPIQSNILKRTKFTSPQFGLKIKERSLNVKDVFKISFPDAVRNKKIILVDDVATTFSTLKECTKLLKRNGASSVFAVVLAHGN